MKKYRSWAQRREIIRAILAETPAPPLHTFDLSDPEERYFRAKTNKAVASLARSTSSFKSYYRLRKSQPFVLIGLMAAAIVVGCVAAFAFLAIFHRHNDKAYPLMAAAVTVSVATIGWTVSGWVSHRNAIVQHTINLIFTRFSQAVYTENLHRFNTAFGHDLHPRITQQKLEALRQSTNEEDNKAAQSVFYILNYFEFISLSMLKGDLDESTIRLALKSIMNFYFDKCEPLITEANKASPTLMEHFIKVRAAYREP